MHDAHKRLSALHEARRLLFLKLENMNEATRDGNIEAMDVEDFGEVLDAIKDTKEIELLHMQCIHAHHTAQKPTSMYAETTHAAQPMAAPGGYAAPASAGRLLTPHQS